MTVLAVVNGVLFILAGVVVGAIMYFFFLIASFYQQKSGQRSHYHLFLASIVLFWVAAVFAVVADKWVDNVVADALFLAGGIVLGAEVNLLYNFMTGGRR